jgi:hypothetical protein
MKLNRLLAPLLAALLTLCVSLQAAPAAAGTTTNIGCTYPTVGADESAWGTILNALFQCFDTEFGTRGIVLAQGRLTLTSATPVTTSDVTAATTVYYTPATGNLVSIYNGTTFRPYVFTELSLALDSNSGHTGYHQTGKNFDAFVISDSGTLRECTGPAWSSDTARGTGAGTTELEQYLGVWVNKVTLTCRFGSASGNTVSVAARQATYVGTLRTTADGQVEDGKRRRFVWNTYNRRPRALLRKETGDNWTYTLLTPHQANANALNQVEVVRGLDEDAVSVALVGAFNNASNVAAGVAIGLDSTSSAASDQAASLQQTQSLNSSAHAWYAGAPGLGYHYLTWLEWSVATGTTTWRGAAAGIPIVLGMSGRTPS